MNKRKSDDEFAKINLSYIGSDGKEVVVYCPESKSALRLRNRCDAISIRMMRLGQATKESPKPEAACPLATPPQVVEEVAEIHEAPVDEPVIEELKEQHYTIHYGATGYSYESIVGPYLEGAKSIEIEDPYIRVTHQIHNFVRFCEAVIKTPTVRKVRLITSYDDDTDVKKMSEN